MAIGTARLFLMMSVRTVIEGELQAVTDGMGSKRLAFFENIVSFQQPWKSKNRLFVLWFLFFALLHTQEQQKEPE
jgi:hypothetical protein